MNTKLDVVIRVLIALIFISVLLGACADLVKNDYQGVLHSTERVCRNSGDSLNCHYEWRFRGTRGYEDEVFINRDSFINWKFNSADFQNKIDAGEEYRLVVTGWRIPVISTFRNVISVEVVR